MIVAAAEEMSGCKIDDDEMRRREVRPFVIRV
jgi:hypothetical protein